METVTPKLATLRLIVTALILGACVIGGTIIFSASRIGGRILDQPVIVYGVVAVMVLQTFAAVVLIPRLISKPAADLPEATLLQTYGKLVMTRVGMVEGAYVLGMIFYLMSQDLALLVVGTIQLLTMIALRPSEQSYQSWKETLRQY